jgi:hypothetical protein
MIIDDTHIIAGVSAAFTCLTGAIAAMWFTLKAENRHLKKRADDCESHRLKLEADKIELWKAIAELKGDSEILDRCPAPKCPMRAPAEKGEPSSSTSRVFLPIQPQAT